MKAPIAPDAIYTVAEAAELLSLHPVTLRRKLRIRLVNGKRRGAGHWRIRCAELLKLA